MVTKICFLSHFNSWNNIIDTSRKRQAVMRMKVDSNKGICTEFGRNVFDGCIDDYDDLSLVDLSMKLRTIQIQDLTCLNLVSLFLECIIHSIEIACTSLLLTNLYPLLCKKL